MLSQTNLSHIPHLPWVYIFKDHRSQILYIGKAKNLNKRVHQYFAVGSVWKQDMMHKADSVEFVVVENENEALMLESNLIKQHLPAYNRLLKWDNSYVYIKITSEPRPQIIFTRTRKDDGAVYIGPKHMRNELKKLLQYLRQLLWYRWCKTNQFKQWKLCSDYLFGICKGRCVYAKLSKNSTTVNPWSWYPLMVEGKNQQKSQQYLIDAIKLWFPTDATFQSWRQSSRYMIQLIVDFFNGETNKILTHITREIDNCIINQNFEYAAKLRDIYRNMDALTTKQSVIVSPSIHGAFYLLKDMGKYRVYCIVTFQQGKMVDILRFKEEQDETSASQIQMQIELEYGACYDLTTSEMSGSMMGTSNQIQSEDLLSIYTQCSRFIENFIISDSRQTNSVMNDILAQLQTRYWLSTYPYRIECMDISHFSGWWASGWLSCLVGGMPDKKFYRQHKIPKEIAGDDLRSLTHLMVSRLKLDSKQLLSDDQLPDVLVLDWWPLQLSIIPKLCKQYPLMSQYLNKIQICGLAKWSARSSWSKIYGAVEQLIIIQSDGSLIAHDLTYDPIDQILIKLRDEAHRFANRYRTKQMGMELK